MIITILKEEFVLLRDKHLVILAFDNVLSFFEGVLILISSEVLSQFPIQIIYLLIFFFKEGDLRFKVFDIAALKDNLLRGKVAYFISSLRSLDTLNE